MELAQPAAWLFAGILAALAFFQLALAAGAPLGHFAWGGQHRVLPKNLRIGSAVAIALYAGFAIIVWDRARLIDFLPDGVSAVLVWALVAFLTLGTLANAFSRSLPERLAMMPVNLVLLGFCLVVVLG